MVLSVVKALRGQKRPHFSIVSSKYCCFFWLLQFLGTCREQSRSTPEVVPGQGRSRWRKVVPGQGRPQRSFPAKVVPGEGRSFLVKVHPRGRSRLRSSTSRCVPGPESSVPRNCSNPFFLYLLNGFRKAQGRFNVKHSAQRMKLNASKSGLKLHEKSLSTLFIPCSPSWTYMSKFQSTFRTWTTCSCYVKSKHCLTFESVFSQYSSHYSGLPRSMPNVNQYQSKNMIGFHR